MHFDKDVPLLDIGLVTERSHCNGSIGL